MRISRSAVYGLGCLLEVAKAKERSITVGEISRTQGLSKDYVEQLLIRFKRKGLVKSIRGLKGGYVLAKKPNLITLKDVIEAQEKKILDIICFKPGNFRCNRGNCGIKPVWLNLNKTISRSLDGIKISELLNKKAQVCK
jgi:Rrf2 family protein